MQAAPIVVTATLACAALVLAAAVTGAASSGAHYPAAPAAPAPRVLPVMPVLPVLPVMPAAPAGRLASRVDDSGAPAVSGPASDLALTDDGQLIADHALRAMMDAYLSHRADTERLQALGKALAARLPPAAVTQARQLAMRYDAYLGQHGALLQAQNFGDRPDLYRIKSWQQQRQQLRERLLGVTVAEQWFGTEEAYLQQALDELALPTGAPSTPSDTEDARRHAERMRQVLAAATGRAARPTPITAITPSTPSTPSTPISAMTQSTPSTPTR